jgi:hypothetical protein
MDSMKRECSKPWRYTAAARLLEYSNTHLTREAPAGPAPPRACSTAATAAAATAAAAPACGAGVICSPPPAPAAAGLCVWGLDAQPRQVCRNQQRVCRQPTSSGRDLMHQQSAVPGSIISPCRWLVGRSVHAQCVGVQQAAHLRG